MKKVYYMFDLPVAARIREFCEVARKAPPKTARDFFLNSVMENEAHQPLKDSGLIGRFQHMAGRTVDQVTNTQIFSLSGVEQNLDRLSEEEKDEAAVKRALSMAHRRCRAIERILSR